MKRLIVEVKATKVKDYRKQDEEVLELKRELIAHGYDVCIKKLANTLPKFNLAVLDDIEVEPTKGDL
ncbi:hypothetical protein F0562_032137 [Nyssa sinensis]|uniref:Uncharacterized protein n=1 Tax=Nyssa sinensis TaxID=561372 RepID=A0A5J5AW77_9ASTE|nr:hypothetical protein F0562_032137 [Nyssa sinensis]